MRFPARCPLVCAWISAISGLILVVSGAALYINFNTVIRSILSTELVLRNNSEVYDLWFEPPVDVLLQLWFFNITNPAAVTAGKKAHVTQVGPYTYRQFTLRNNIHFSADGELLAYTSNNTFFFDPEKSVGPENDTFYQLNLPLVSMASLLDPTLSDEVKSALWWTLYFSGETIFRKYTVSEYLWGYKDPFFHGAKGLLKSFSMEQEATLIPDDIGVFTGPQANGTKSGDWVAYTGLNHQFLFNSIYSWNGKQNMSSWNSPYANMINGSDGAMWHSVVETHEDLYMFFYPICRSLKSQYNRTVRSKGLELYQFVLAEDMFESAEDYPPNQAYCTPTCLPRGLLNLTNCNGSPLVLSKPHFLHADQSVTQNITGLEAREEYETHTDLHMYSGAGIYIENKLQFNLYLKTFDILSETENVLPTYFPLFWMNASAEVNDDYLISLCKKIDSMVVYLVYVRMGCLVLGSLLCIAWIFVCLRIFRKNKHKTKSDSAEDDDESTEKIKVNGLSHSHNSPDASTTTSLVQPDEQTDSCQTSI